MKERSRAYYTYKKRALDAPSQNGTLGDFFSEEFQIGAQETMNALRKSRIEENIRRHEANARGIRRRMDKLNADLKREMCIIDALKKSI